MSGAAAAQSNALLQKVIREEIETIPSETFSGASASVRRGAPVDDESLPNIIDLLTVHPSSEAKRDAMRGYSYDDPPPNLVGEELARFRDEIRDKSTARSNLAMSLTDEEKNQLYEQFDDLPDFAKDNPLGGAGLGAEERARENIYSTFFRDPVAEGLSGPVGFRSGVEGGVGSAGEGVGGTFQGSGFYVSMANLYRKAYAEMFNSFAKDVGGVQINTKFAVDLNPESTAHWDAYLVDQPELVKRQLYGISKALFQFRDWQPSRVYPAKMYSGEKYGGLRTSGMESPEEFEKIISDAQLANQAKYDLSEGEQILTFEGLSRNGEDYISVDLIIPDFRPKWDSLRGGWISGLEDAKKAVGLFRGRDLAERITKEDIRSYTDWAEGENTLTVQKWGWEPDNTLNNPVTRSQWADEVADEMDGILGADDAYDRMIRPTEMDEFTEIPLNYDIDMVDIGGRATKKNVNDMKTMYYSDVYRILEDTLEKTFKSGSKEELVGRINPKFRTKEGMGAEDAMFSGVDDEMDDAFTDAVKRLAPEETTAILKRFGISSHEYLSEALFMDTEDASKLLFDTTSEGHRGFLNKSPEDFLYHIGSDRLNNAHPVARRIISDPQMADAHKLGVIYDDKWAKSLESAAIDMSHYGPKKTPEEAMKELFESEKFKALSPKDQKKLTEEFTQRHIEDQQQLDEQQEAFDEFTKRAQDWDDPDDLYDLDFDGRFLATENNYNLLKEGKMPYGLEASDFVPVWKDLPLE
tara:strand:- start:450 stop:2702 length:2253 start_codon:yes stop_codon:yes gene_type:complete